MSDKTSLGDKCKYFESLETSRKAMKGLPLMARLDGIAFHTFTKGLKRPYHQGLCDLMISTAKRLVEETHAIIGYTQSDEITLTWYVPADSPGEYMHGGKYQKLCSRLAAIATGHFNHHISMIPEKVSAPIQLFDCRIWQVPSLDEAFLSYLWRERDATKNSITMAAGAYYSHRELHGKNSADKHDMLHEKGVNWNDYPSHFKRGTYVRIGTVDRHLTEEELSAIPEKHRPTGIVTRGCMETMEIPPLDKIANPVDVLFRRIAVIPKP